MAGVDPAAAAGRARRLPSVTPTKASLHVDVISLSGADSNIGNLWPPGVDAAACMLKWQCWRAQKDIVDPQSVFHVGLAALSVVS